MVIGFIKVILILWIANAVYRWYKQATAGKGRRNPATDHKPDQDTGAVHSGRIVDAEFEEMDGGTDKTR